MLERHLWVARPHVGPVLVVLSFCCSVFCVRCVVIVLVCIVYVYVDCCWKFPVCKSEVWLLNLVGLLLTRCSKQRQLSRLVLNIPTVVSRFVPWNSHRGGTYSYLPAYHFVRAGSCLPLDRNYTPLSRIGWWFRFQRFCVAEATGRMKWLAWHPRCVRNSSIYIFHVHIHIFHNL